MNSRVLQLDARDNVLIALNDLRQGDAIEYGGKTYSLVSNIPAKHKFATTNIAAGDDVVMYGVLVGKAVRPIACGELLTTSNIQHQAAPFHEHAGNYRWSPPDVSCFAGQT